MPFISIIIPTYNNEEHIEQSIDSCFNSDFDDFEIIVINDASTDGTAAKLGVLVDRYAGKIKINHSETNIGPGPARNIGLEQAKGEYIMFLDGDDWFEPDAVKIVAEKLKEVEPDVLMFNHQRVWENGIIIPNIPNKYVKIENKEQDLSEPSVRKKAMRNLHCPCNKAYKKEFIHLNSIIFPIGIYEDVTWSIEALIKAKKTHYIPKIVFNYRQRWGSITRNNNHNHFDIFGHLKKVKKELEKKDIYKTWYSKEIYKYARALLFGIINTQYRIPKEQEREFFTETTELLFNWRRALKLRNIDILLWAAYSKNTLLYLSVNSIIKCCNINKNQTTNGNTNAKLNNR